MSNMLKDELENIIAAASLDPKLHRALSETLGALADRQMALEKDLWTAINIEQATAARQDLSDTQITTGLVDAQRLAELSAWGLFDAAAGYVPLPAKICFLAVPYDELNIIFQSRYKAANGAEYQLSPWYGYVENEEKLDLLWRLYGFKTPRPFSPWARRAVRIRFCQPVEDKPDLNLAQNGLDDILLRDKALVWNVDIQNAQKAAQSNIIKDTTQLPQLRVACRGVVGAYRYYYTARDGDQTLWPLPQDIADGTIPPEAVDAAITDETIILTSASKFSTLSCAKVAIHAPSTLRDFVPLAIRFDDKWRFREPVTRGEFNRLLAALSTKDFTASFSGSGKRNVRRYEKGHRIARFRNTLPHRGDPLDVFFECSNAGKAIFLEDYANWILEELEQRFPVFYWRGWF